ncbi:TIM barrel protein, partial [Escherichia coli]|uniref:TIM barrel protein n=1 Tax=Escherichia coli TaxID=562 RepID=UPI0022B19A2D
NHRDLKPSVCRQSKMCIRDRTNTMTQWADKIGHLQIADNPHRGEPGTGEINYEYLFTVIENSDYNGWVGCEYKPQTTTEAGLRWMDPYR